MRRGEIAVMHGGHLDCAARVLWAPETDGCAAAGAAVLTGTERCSMRFPLRKGSAVPCGASGQTASARRFFVWLKRARAGYKAECAAASV